MTVSESTAASPPPRQRSPLQVVFVVLAIALGLVVIYRIQTVILAFILAVFFAYLIAPLVFVAERLLRTVTVPQAWSRGLAIGLVYLVMCTAVGTATVILTPRLSQQATGIAAQAPEYVVAIRAWSIRWSAYERAKLPPGFRARVDAAVVSATDAALVRVQESVVATLTVLTYLPWLVLIPVLSFFLLKDLDVIRYHAVQALPPRLRGPGYRMVQELNTALAAYIRAQLLACLLIGTVCGLGFALLGVPYAALLGVLAGVLEFIPLVGPLVVALVTAVVAAVSSTALAIWVSVFLIVVRIVEDYVVYPRLMGHGTHLHPLAIILAVLIGVELGGVMGIFLAVPVASTLSVAYRHWIDWERVRTETSRTTSVDRTRDSSTSSAH